MHKDPCEKCENVYDYTCYLVDIQIVIIVLGSLLTVGLFSSFGFQIKKLYDNKSTDGISFQMLHLALYNQWSQFINFFMSQFPQVMSCGNTFWKCISNIIPQINSIFCFIGFLVQYLQFIYYQYKEERYSSLFKRNLLLSAIFLCYVSITLPGLIVSGLNYSVCDQTFRTFTLIFAIISMCCAFVQWIPQIVITQKIKSVGSFSIISLCINVPGQLISLITLIMSKDGWSTWIINIVQLILLIYLLSLLIRYTYCEPYKTRNQQNGDGQQQEQLVENTNN
ncbi:PQ_loop repeat-containing protein [Hexamita inflata]|uniref:PQ loop repeat-containing protein n=1 Tax=Hexamita inflata TaxID=28002 RepID=A0AA86NSD5_9EUKA|nr:PQ loop repeat-containing protein [Hexamita inflata]